MHINYAPLLSLSKGSMRGNDIYLKFWFIICSSSLTGTYCNPSIRLRSMKSKCFVFDWNFNPLRVKIFEFRPSIQVWNLWIKHALASMTWPRSKWKKPMLLPVETSLNCSPNCKSFEPPSAQRQPTLKKVACQNSNDLKILWMFSFLMKFRKGRWVMALILLRRSFPSLAPLS